MKQPLKSISCEEEVCTGSTPFFTLLCCGEFSQWPSKVLPSTRCGKFGQLLLASQRNLLEIFKILFILEIFKPAFIISSFYFGPLRLLKNKHCPSIKFHTNCAFLLGAQFFALHCKYYMLIFGRFSCFQRGVPVTLLEEEKEDFCSTRFLLMTRNPPSLWRILNVL